MVNHAPQLSRAEFSRLCETFHVAKCDRRAIADLVYHGKPVGKALHAKLDGRWRCSRKNGEYAKFMVAILNALSATCQHQFPPKDYKAPKGYQFYA